MKNTEILTSHQIIEMRNKICSSSAVMSLAKQDELAEEAKSWILERYDQRVVDASEINYRLNDEVCCSRVINGMGVFKGILTIWEERGSVKFHFDRAIVAQ